MAQNSDDDTDDLEYRQRLKAALHYGVGQVCSDVEGTTFSRELVAAITETTYKQCELLATDVELFAKHAKRTTVSMEDVKLCCRRSPSLLEFMTGQADKLKAEKEAGKEGGKEGGGGGGGGSSEATAGTNLGRKKTKGGRKKTAVVIDDD